MSRLTALGTPSPTFSAAVACDGWLHISGQIASDAAGRVEGDCAAQAQRCLEKIDALLGAAGASRSDVVRLAAFLIDAADYRHYAAAKAAWVAQPAPAGTAVVVAGLLVQGARIEIEATARLPV